MVTAGVSLGRFGLEEFCCSSQRQQPQVWWLHFPPALHTQLGPEAGFGVRVAGGLPRLPQHLSLFRLGLQMLLLRDQ